MDPISHLVIATALVGRDRATLVGSLLPDLPWYLLYPLWLSRRGHLDLQATGWPLPPEPIQAAHYATHSLFTLAALCLILRLLSKRARRLCLAWLLHILVDAPTHSRERMAPRPFWPASHWAMDGISWADWLTDRVRRIRGAGLR